jgi:signal transduction histidine kinase
MYNRFERILSSRNDVDNSLLLIEELLISRTRDRSQDVENRRQTTFEVFINREFSRFEHVKAKTTILQDESLA